MQDADWPQVYRFFGEIVAAGRTYAYPDGLDSAAARALWEPAPPAYPVVAVEVDTVLGSATMGPNRPGRGSHVATASFMVDPAAAGRGLGRALGGYVIGGARDARDRGIQFNAVGETNAPARHLWQAPGVRGLRTVPGAVPHAA